MILKNFHIQNIELYQLIIIFTKETKKNIFISQKQIKKQTYNIDDLVLMSHHYNHVYNYYIVDVFLIDIDFVLDYLYMYDLKDIDKDLNQLNLNLTDVKDMNNHQ
jgi:hypothetical protein